MLVDEIDNYVEKHCEIFQSKEHANDTCSALIFARDEFSDGLEKIEKTNQHLENAHDILIQLCDEDEDNLNLDKIHSTANTIINLIHKGVRQINHESNEFIDNAVTALERVKMNTHECTKHL